MIPQTVLTAATLIVAVLAGLLILLIARALYNRFKPIHMNAGEDCAMISCKGCEMIAVAFMPSYVAEARQVMTEHAAMHHEHGSPVEEIPPGWES